ncbi:hypothetical protein [uncultured Pseudokineococcus sp.]|uniref:hypothetical protein n=1 Tax=uncultured Pseudokineococcus sp. TaxID=1642928 RepID=UPI00263098FE|nr:hypothetical protein [uncultured Pseudokineococcus sp.]
MGGGWSSSRAAAFRRSLADRHDGHEGAEHEGSAEQVVDQRRGEGRQEEGRARGGRGTHCWVLIPDTDPMPGVVAGWRRDHGGAWEARVAYALGDDGSAGAAGTAGVVTGWLPASCLRPYPS